MDDVLAGLEASCGGDILSLNEALNDLAGIDSDVATYVDLRFFGGRTNSEAAACLGVSERTGDRYWDFARRWLGARLRA